MPDQDRVKEWDEVKRMHEILSPSGGMAVWVLNKADGLPTPFTAVRQGPKDFAEAAILLANLAIGIDKLIESIAKVNGWDPGQLGKATADAANMLVDRLESCARVVESKE